MDMRKWVAETISADKKKAVPVLSFPAIQPMGITVAELIGSSEKQAEAMRLVAERCDTGASVSFMDLSVEAEAFGSKIVVSDDEVPTVVGAIVDEDSDPDDLEVPEVGAGRTGLYLEAIEKACQEISDRPVLAGVIGPFSLAGMAAPEGMLRLYPHRVRGEGHFIACLTKSGEAPAADLLRPAAERLSPPSPPLRAAFAAFAAHLTGLPDANAQFGDVLIAAPDLPPLDHLRVLRAGVQLGLLKGRVFVPDHALAMVLSPACGLPCVALCRADALRYQRGEALPVSESLAGWALVVYEGLVLGLGKASGGQLKNHYPKGLRRP